MVLKNLVYAVLSVRYLLATGVYSVVVIAWPAVRMRHSTING